MPKKEPSSTTDKVWRGIAGGSSASVLALCYALFATKEQLKDTKQELADALSEVRVEAQATRDSLMMVKGALKLEARYE